MADIELVIKIPEEKYDAIESDLYNTFSAELKEWGLEAIRNGSPLPKGHGRLIDISPYEKYFNTAISYDDGNHINEVCTNSILTIIEADTESEG